MMRRETQNALQYVAPLLLAPYPAGRRNRGDYISASGQRSHYPTIDAIETPEAGAVYRLTYGLAYATRVVANIEEAITVCIAQHPNFAAILDDDTRCKLAITAAFCSAGRENEAHFDPARYSDYQQFLRQSAHLFENYVRALRRDHGYLFTPEEIQLYKTALTTPHGKEDPLTKIALLAKILAIAQITAASDAGNIEHLLAAIGVKRSHSSIVATAMDNLFQCADSRLKLLGDRQGCVFDYASKKYHPLKTMHRMALFQLSSTNLSVAIQLIALSKKIASSEQANSLAIMLVMRALSTHDFAQLLAKLISLTPTQIAVLLTYQSKRLKDIEGGRLVKTVQLAHWDMTARGLIRLRCSCRADCHCRPELRSLEQRTSRFTIRLAKDGKYEVVHANKGARAPKLLPHEKARYSRPQSATFLNPQVGYNSPVFGDTTARHRPVVGFSFDPNDAHYQRIMYYDSKHPTFNRPYDYPTYKEAERNLLRLTQSGEYHTSLSVLQSDALLRNPERMSEIMARLRWNTDTSHIIIFADNLHSRLLTQVCVADLRLRLPQPAPIVPISFYPAFTPYTTIQQKEDSDAASDIPELLHYVIILRFLNTMPITRKDYPASVFDETAALLEKINPDRVEEYKRFLKAQQLIVSSAIAITTENIKTTMQLIKALSNTTPEKQQQLLQMRSLDEMRRLIYTFNDYKKIAHVLQPKQPFHLLYEKASTILIDLAIESPACFRDIILFFIHDERITRDFINHIKIALTKQLFSLTEKHIFLLHHPDIGRFTQPIIFEALKDHIAPCVTSPIRLIALGRDLNSDNAVNLFRDIIAQLAPHIPRLFKEATSDTLIKTVKIFLIADDELNILFPYFLAHLPAAIVSLETACQFIKCLRDDAALGTSYKKQRQVLEKAIVDRMTVLMTSSDQLPRSATEWADIITHLSTTHCHFVLDHALASSLPRILTTLLNKKIVLAQLTNYIGTSKLHENSPGIKDKQRWLVACALTGVERCGTVDAIVAILSAHATRSKEMVDAYNNKNRFPLFKVNDGSGKVLQLCVADIQPTVRTRSALSC